MPNIDVCYGARVTQLGINDGRIEQINVTCNGTTRTLHPQALVDTAGNASIIRQIDQGLVEDGGALGGFIIQLRGLTPDALQFPKASCY